jgi:hypothetical protein
VHQDEHDHDDGEDDLKSAENGFHRRASVEGVRSR